MAHTWPGNVRELRNTMARLVLFGEDALFPSSRRPTVTEPQRASASDAQGRGVTHDDDGDAPSMKHLFSLPWSEARDVVVEFHSLSKSFNMMVRAGSSPPSR